MTECVLGCLESPDVIVYKRPVNVIQRKSDNQPYKWTKGPSCCDNMYDL